MSSKLTKFDAGRIDSLIREINAALKPIEDKYGLKDLKLGRVGYTAAEFKCSIHVKIGADASDSAAVLKRQMELSRAIGFAENVFGREMIGSDNQRYKVVDINTRKPKYPIIAACTSNPDKKLLFTKNVKFIGEQPKTVYQETIDRIHSRGGLGNTTIQTVNITNPNFNNKP